MVREFSVRFSATMKCYPSAAEWFQAAQEKVALLMRAQQQAVQALQQVQQAQPVGAYKCHLCPDSFTDEVQRHMHIIHKHHHELRVKRADTMHTPTAGPQISFCLYLLHYSFGRSCFVC